jgi:stage III sporulation protein AH
MKNIFKKNQIIITALAIMICIAGYLSFTNDDKKKDADSVATVTDGQEDADAITGTEDADLAEDTADAEDAADAEDTADITDAAEETDAADAEDVSDDKDADADTGNDEDAAAVDEEDTQTADAEDGETVPVESESGTEDISDEDILNTANDVTDTGELDLNDDDTTPGEAVLASTTLDAGYFSSAKITREQMRSRNRETLMMIIESPDVSDAEKKAATDSLIQLTNIAEKENSIEILLQAKGFDEAVVSIDDGDVEVIVNAESITEQQTAIIEDLVTRKADVTVDHITITPVVMGE